MNLAEPRLSKSLQGVKEGGVNGEQVVNYQAASMRRKENIKAVESCIQSDAELEMVGWK